MILLAFATGLNNVTSLNNTVGAEVASSTARRTIASKFAISMSPYGSGHLQGSSRSSADVTSITLSPRTRPRRLY
jgi:hypothetical protein